mgnify:CR=1 FL=1
MNLLARAQELARRFNEDEAVQQEFERRQFHRKLFSPDLLWPEEILDDLDWQHAQATCRQTRAISVQLP